MSLRHLTEFLRARLDEDEATALAAHAEWQEEVVAENDHDELPSRGWWDVPQASYRFAQHWSPARVLSEVETKRRIVADAAAVPTISMRHVLKLLAQPYASHPDFDPAWRIA